MLAQIFYEQREDGFKFFQRGNHCADDGSGNWNGKKEMDWMDRSDTRSSIRMEEVNEEWQMSM